MSDLKPVPAFPLEPLFPPGVRGWVLYDDTCGLCISWILFWSRTLERRGFRVAPLQSPGVAQRLAIAPERLLDDLRILLADGRRFDGADVYRHALQNIWWARPLYVFAVLPGTRRLFNWGYRTFANNRYRFSSACRLPAAPRAAPAQARSLSRRGILARLRALSHRVAGGRSSA